MEVDLQMRAERTPNPDSVKWVFGRPLIEPGRSASFTEAPSPAVSPLAVRIFAVPGVTAVFAAGPFVTVTKRPELAWPELAQPLTDALEGFVASGEPALGPDFEDAEESAAGPVATRIRQVLDQEIRPYVAQHGGDVFFVDYREGRVELMLQGSCSGCPSSTATLKLGIEARLQEAVPEVNEVVAL
jgi:Fe-S cluster biogenesis protein NfuA